MDREAFLGRVGRASLTSILPDPPPVPVRLPSPEATDLSALFRARAQAANAVVHGPVTRHGAPRAVLGIVAGHNASSFIAWDHLPAPGVATALAAEGMERVEHVMPEGDREDHNLAYSGVDVGVTGADAALAESGSLVLVHGEGRPRTASLVPDVHVALLDMSLLAYGLAHWAHDNPGLAADTASLVMVTGPSRTGDIELTLNLGVHGPRHVHIVMIK